MYVIKSGRNEFKITDREYRKLREVADILRDVRDNCTVTFVAEMGADAESAMAGVIAAIAKAGEDTPDPTAIADAGVPLVKGGK